MVARKKINLEKSNKLQGRCSWHPSNIKEVEFELGETWYAGDRIISDNNSSDRFLEEYMKYDDRRLEEMESQELTNK